MDEKDSLKELRLERGKRLWEVAEALGISLSYASLLENGKRGLSLMTAVKLAKVYNVTLETIHQIANRKKLYKKRKGDQ